MAHPGPLNPDIARLIARGLHERLPPEFDIAWQAPWRDDVYDAPEIFIFTVGRYRLGGNDDGRPEVRVAIQIVQSHDEQNSRQRSIFYSDHGVPQLWVVDVERGQTLVYALGRDGSYGAPLTVPFGDPLTTPGGVGFVIASFVAKG